MPTCNFTKKNSLPYPPSCILPSFSKNASRLLLLKRLWKCSRKISFRKYKQTAALLLIFLFNYDSLRQLPSCWMWHLTLSWARFLSNKLELQYRDFKKIVLFSACVFWYVVHFDKKLILLHHCDNTFLFYFHIYIKLTLSAIILTIEKW